MAVSSADKKKLGKWIKQAREKKQPHLSQRQLALAVDITNASLSSIESGMIFPSEELLLKLIEQLQPPPELREKMLALFAKAKGTSPPDINAELSKNPKLWGLIRQLIAVDPSEEQVSPIFLVALLYGSYPMSVMFSYCLIEGRQTARLFCRNALRSFAAAPQS